MRFNQIRQLASSAKGNWKTYKGATSLPPAPKEPAQKLLLPKVAVFSVLVVLIGGFFFIFKDDLTYRPESKKSIKASEEIINN